MTIMFLSIFVLTSVHIVFYDVTQFVGQMAVLVVRNCRPTLKKII